MTENVELRYVSLHCQLLFLFQSSHKPHILQHAVKMKDYEFVKMLCHAGADVNLRVLINEYFWVNIFFKMLKLFWCYC